MYSKIIKNSLVHRIMGNDHHFMKNLITKHWWALIIAVIMGTLIYHNKKTRNKFV
ncbi:MAG: hypothetical protein ACOXZ5_09460 [Syntrophomonadaceae bacterium]|jgi:amino acid permease